MPALRTCALLIASAVIGFAQVDSNSVTVTETRPVFATSDQLQFIITVSSTSIIGLDQLLAPISGLSLTAADLSSLDNQMPEPYQEAASFRLVVPYSAAQTTIAALSALAQTISQNNSGLALDFFSGTAQPSNQSAVSQQCPLTDMLNDARARAQKLARAAGLFLGPVIAVSDGTVSQNAAAPERQAAMIYFLGYPTPQRQQPSVTCSLTVKFRLLH